ncbi:MAG: C25 family cysteine peptidase [Bacteroidales bacterium]
MKSIITILAGLLLSSILVAENITMTYTIKDPEIKTAGEFVLVEFEDALTTGIPGEPALPYFPVKVLLPPGESATNITFKGSDIEVIKGNYTLYPQQPSRPVSEGKNGTFQINRDVYEKNGIYPGSPGGHPSTEFMNGYSIALCSFTPVRYNPSTGELSYFKEITVTIKTARDQKAGKALSNLIPSGHSTNKVIKLIQNKKAINSYPPNTTRTADAYELLIVSPSQFEPEFDALRDMYLVRGLRSEFIAVEEIGNTMPGQDLQEKIRNYIIQEYQDSYIAYVLLGGDIAEVPYRGFYCYVESGSGYEDNDIPSDLYYSALDGTWNDDGDNKWGEPGEDDLLPEVAVARLPFSDTAELHNMLHKTISYQDNPVTGEMTFPLMAGEHLYSSPLTWGADYLDLLIGYHDDNGYTTIGIPEDHNIYELYDRTETWGTGDILARINEGRSFIHHSGHSNATYTMRLYISDITNANFYAVNGMDHNYTLVYTHGCICGAFDENDCIAEKMLYIDNFAVAGAFNSRYGWFNEGQTEGPSAHLHREFTDALYEEKIDRIGATHMESKIQTAPWVTAPGQWEEGALRWCFYDCNILGDPALAVWTDEPISIYVSYPQTVPIGTASININVTSNGTPQENFNCTFFMGDTFHGTGTTDNLGNATIIFDPPITTVGTGDLTVSGYNCLPQTYAVDVIPASGPYVIYESHSMEEILGNQNGLPDYGEYAFLNLTMENAGTEDAEDVEVILHAQDTMNYMDFEDSTGIFEMIPSGSTATAHNAYTFYIADDVPDQHTVNVSVMASNDQKEVWNSNFQMTMLAPAPVMGTVSVDDQDGGNGNGLLDPGETAKIIIPSSNEGHSDGYEAFGKLSTGSPDLVITDTIYDIGLFPCDTIAYLEFPVEVPESALPGTLVHFDYWFETGAYTIDEHFSLTLGLMIEDFETGDFSKFDWEFNGNAPWEICTDHPYEGTYCMASGDIDDNQTSEISVSLSVLSQGEISFFRKVSSEPGYDYLQFLIDGELAGEWAGEKDWEEMSFSVDAGDHTFTWIYNKDMYVSSGQDRAWIDYIVFPPVSPSTALADHQGIPANIVVYPNPFHEFLNIDLELQERNTVSIDLFNVSGELHLNVLSERILEIGRYRFKAERPGLTPGVYIMQIQIGNSSIIKKIIRSSG